MLFALLLALTIDPVASESPAATATTVSVGSATRTRRLNRQQPNRRRLNQWRLTSSHPKRRKGCRWS